MMAMKNLEEKIIILLLTFLELKNTYICICSIESPKNPVRERPFNHFYDVETISPPGCL
jgi:hypothetical protein